MVGLCVARALARRGEAVSVVEAGPVGGGASLGNGGWVSPSLAAPLPAPGVVRRALRWTFERDAPARLDLRLRPELWRWCWRFARACEPRRFEAGMRALLGLNADAVRLYREMAGEGLRIEMRSDGLLYVARTKASLDHYRHDFEEMRRLGYGGEVESFDRVALLREEPALSPALVGGLLARGDATVRPEAVTAALAADLRERGAAVHERRRVRAVHRDHGGWVLATDAGELRGERVVLAAGSRLAELAKGLGVTLPLQPGKGYSLTGPGRGERPRHALYLTEALVGATPFGGALRIVGDLHLGSDDTAVAPRAAERLARRFGPYLRDWRPEGCEPWAGLRPFVPDGLPLIGALPGCPGAFVAGAHGMLGVTLAPATGAALAESILDGRSRLDLAPFRVERFARRQQLLRGPARQRK